MADLTRTIEIDPNYALAYALRGEVYSRIGERGLAISDLVKALEIGLDPRTEQRSKAILEELEQ